MDIFRYAYHLGTPPPSCGLAELMKVCEEYGIEMIIVYTPSKSALMVIRSHNDRNLGVSPFYLKDQVLTECLDDRYLGHTITADLRDDNDFERQLRVLDAQWNMLENCMCVVKMWRCTSLRPTLNLCMNCPPMVELQ